MIYNPNNMLYGIIPPMVTPLRDRDVIDYNGLEVLVEHILSGGVHGLFILGTTGEAPSLSYRLRYELVELVCRQVNQRVPVFVGITDTSFSESVGLARWAAEKGAYALVVAPPYYLPMAQSELLEYFSRLAPAVPLPLVLYNMPGCTKVKIEPDTVQQVAEIPGILGLKDSSGEMLYFTKVKYLMQRKPEFHLLIGPEELLAESLWVGGNGGVCGGANMFPRLYVDLYNAFNTCNQNEVQRLHQIILQISTTIYSVGKHSSAIIKGIKCVLNLLGICEDFMAEPFHRFHKPQREILQGYLDTIVANHGQQITTMWTHNSINNNRPSKE